MAGESSYYFVVALHYDIAITTWSILAVVVWQQLFHRWVYTDDVGTDHTTLSRSVFRHGDSILQVRYSDFGSSVPTHSLSIPYTHDSFTVFLPYLACANIQLRAMPAFPVCTRVDRGMMLESMRFDGRSYLFCVVLSSLSSHRRRRRGLFLPLGF